jgi:hypothetical protein
MIIQKRFLPENMGAGAAPHAFFTCAPGYEARSALGAERAVSMIPDGRPTRIIVPGNRHVGSVLCLHVDLPSTLLGNDISIIACREHLLVLEFAADRLVMFQR